jgi:hypothetical protein
METLRAAVCVALLALAGTAPAARAVQGNVSLVGPPRLEAVASDGSRLFVETNAPLAAEDTDAEIDVYAIEAGVPELLSAGPAGGNAPFRPATFEGASADGSRVVFRTREALVPGDTDDTHDLYEHSGGEVALLTPAESTFLGMALDGEHVFFATSDPLVAADTDATADIYDHVDGAARLVSVGPGGANVVESSFRGHSADGGRAWFQTREALSPQDDDSTGVDVYERSADTTSLVTDWPAGAGGSTDHALLAASDDGERLLIRTSGQVTPDDTDTAADLFEVSSAGTALVSTGPADAPGGGDAALIAASADGARVYFTSPEALVAGRPGGAFERAGGVTTWLGGAVSSLAVSADGAATYFVTGDALVPEDTHPGADIYVRSGSGTALVSSTFSADSPRVEAVSSDAGKLFFATTTPLDPADADFTEDLYALSDAVLYITSAGPTSWPAAPPGIANVTITPAGDQAFFETFDRLTPEDGDTEPDVYEARFPDTSGYPRPRGATPLRVPLVPAFERCTAPNRMHAPPLEFGSCSPPVRAPGRLTVGTPDSNGEAANSVGFVRLATVVGEASTPEDEADVRIELHAVDVREASGLGDYTGELELALRLRITARDALDGPAVPVTVEDAELSIAATCAATTDATVGSTCDLATSAEALIPGVVVEGRRTIWAHRAVRVFDGGADGDAETLGDNGLFQVQGVFVP